MSEETKDNKIENGKNSGSAKLFGGLAVLILVIAGVFLYYSSGHTSSINHPKHYDKLLISISDRSIANDKPEFIYKLTAGAGGYLITLDNQSYIDKVVSFIDEMKAKGKKVIVTYTDISYSYGNNTQTYKTFFLDDVKDKIDGVLIIASNSTNLDQVVDDVKSHYPNAKVYVFYNAIYYVMNSNNATNSTNSTLNVTFREIVPLNKILNNSKIDGVYLSISSNDKKFENDVINKLKKNNKEIIRPVTIQMNPFVGTPLFNLVWDNIEQELNDNNNDYVVYISYSSLVPNIIRNIGEI